MQHGIKKKASAIRELRTIQRQLATAGEFKEARQLHERITPASEQIILAWLGVKELPEHLNAHLVREISEAAAAAAERNETAKLRGLLRRAAWTEEIEITKKLIRAKASLPDLQKVEQSLR